MAGDTSMQIRSKDVKKKKVKDKERKGEKCDTCRVKGLLLVSRVMYDTWNLLEYVVLYAGANP